MIVQNVFKVGEGLNKTLSFKNTIPPSNIGGFDWSCIEMRPIKVRDGPLEKLWGEWGIFEPQEFFFGGVPNSLYEFF